MFFLVKRDRDRAPLGCNMAKTASSMSSTRPLINGAVLLQSLAQPHD